MKTKSIAFLALLVVQVFVSIVYKISQTKGKYTYSPLSVIASAEFIKLCMSITALCFQLDLNTKSLSFVEKITSRLNASRLLIIKEVNATFILLTCGLASLYLINNQLAFVLFLFVNIALISISEECRNV